MILQFKYPLASRPALTIIFYCILPDKVPCAYRSVSCVDTLLFMHCLAMILPSLELQPQYAIRVLRSPHGGGRCEA